MTAETTVETWAKLKSLGHIQSLTIAALPKAYLIDP